jgi:glucosylceramidase
MRKQTKTIFQSLIILLLTSLLSCSRKAEKESSSEQRITIYQTSASGDQFKRLNIDSLNALAEGAKEIQLTVDTAISYQSILGFGGAFTESTCHLLMALDSHKRKEILERYFGDDGARYSLTRTHINSCDFSLGSYDYLKEDYDTTLSSFSLSEDKDDIIPIIQMAQEHSKGGFRIIASPWTAPPWMKTNKQWFGGKLEREYYGSWSRYFSKYISEMRKENIDIWGVTVENEPLGNNENWESMHYTPQEMGEFVSQHLKPEFEKLDPVPKILYFDQNRDEDLLAWADALLEDSLYRSSADGFAVHWYNSTVDWMPDNLLYVKNKAKDKHLIHTEACIDADTPRWKQDDWYWQANATDWGWDWASEEKKKDHPKYTPVYRYAKDIIGCMNSMVEGWIDWNMVLDRQGGPNHVQNWCIAPIIVDTALHEVYYTPLFYVMEHFSKFIRPGSVRIHIESDSPDIMCTAFKTTQKEVVLVVLNTRETSYSLQVNINGQQVKNHITPKSLQTILISETR